MKSCDGIQEAKNVIFQKFERDVGFKSEVNYFHSDKGKVKTGMKRGWKLPHLILPAVCIDPIKGESENRFGVYLGA